MNNKEYQEIVVESFILEKDKTSGQHGLIHLRPLPNQFPFGVVVFVE